MLGWALATKGKNGPNLKIDLNSRTRKGRKRGDKGQSQHRGKGEGMTDLLNIGAN